MASINVDDIFKNSDLLIRCKMFGKVKHLNLMHDIECEYMYELSEQHDGTQQHAKIDVDKNHYTKLFKECPFLQNLPKLENTIVAGGIVNIALDDKLSYDSFPTSDIDIFVTGSTGMDDCIKLFQYFDTLDAKYKKFADMVNAYLPNYNRSIQIIWQDKKDIFACISRFHSSHVKCGLSNGIIYTMPDCVYTLRNRIAIVDENTINAYTLSKIIKRGYIPFNYENFMTTDLSNYPSVLSRQQMSKNVDDETHMNSKEALTYIKIANFDRKPQCLCPELICKYEL